MKNNLLKASIITANVICLLISLRIFYACGIFADEHNLSTESVFGGSFWLILNWISFASLLINVFLLMITVYITAYKSQSARLYFHHRQY